MSRLTNAVLGALVVAALAGCSAAAAVPEAQSEAGVDAGMAPKDAAPPARVEDDLQRLLSGKFDSKDQAKEDKTYFEISLDVCRVDAPELGQRVLYVEQARVGSAPYRQRIYVIEGKGAAVATSRVFEMKALQGWAGTCSRPTRTVAAAEVEEKVGCAVEMHAVAGGFQGATGDFRWTGSAFEKNPGGMKCPSDLNGASYASSTVELNEQGMVSWDRGYTDAEKQVWGATAGGYKFVRRSE